MDYITNDVDTIIFGPSFNSSLNPTILTNYKQIIFSNYKLDPNLFDVYENIHTFNYYERYKNNTRFDEFDRFKYLRSIFNLSSNIPTSTTNLTLGSIFNHPIDALPSTIRVLTFGLINQFQPSHHHLYI